MEQNEVLMVQSLSKAFPARRTFFEWLQRKPALSVKAVDYVSFSVKTGEVVGLVGESGCGKSTLARVLTRLYPADGGDILFNGESIVNPAGREDLHARTRIQMVFQDPYASLNPRMTIRQMLYEIMDVHHLCEKADREKQAVAFLGMVGMDASALDRHPGEFSGGQRQRISIARALIVKPDLLIADEPVSALDVSIQAQVINLLIELKEKLQLSMLFISHDLSVIRYISDRVVVMYLGSVVELASTETLFCTPAHPYTKILMEAAPEIGKAHAEASAVIKGDLPSPMHIPSGCRFHTRCPYATEVCAREKPPLVEMEAGHFTACHHPLNNV